MADPFSIISLLDTAASLTKVVLQYASAVKNAPDELEKLKRGFTSVHDVFEQLTELMGDDDFRQEFADVSALYIATGDFVVTMEILEKTLKRLGAANGASRTVIRIKWPFERTKTQELIQTLQKYIQVFQFALTIKGSKILAQTSQKASEIMKTSKTLSQTQSEILEALSALPQHDEIIAELQKLRIDLVSVQSQGQKSSEQEFLYKVSTLDFHSKQKHAYSKRHASTGQWLLETEQFKTWFEGKGSLVLWCPGNPGTGKTVLTSIAVNCVAETTRGQDIAIIYVYCDYKDSSTHSVNALLSSLLRQLIEQSPRAESIAELSMMLNENAKYRDPTEAELFTWVCTVSKDFKDVYVFVDALDECPELSRDALLLRLQQLSQFGQTRLFLTSRPNIAIKSRLPNLSRIEIAASAPDIEAYLHSEIQKSGRLALFVRKNPGLKQEIVDRVIGKAHGMFLLASLQISSLCQQISPRKVRQVLDGLPTGIFATYDNAFSRMLDQPKGDAELGMKVMSLVFCATRPLGLEELRHALAAQPGDYTLDTAAFTEAEIILSTTTGLLSTFAVDDPKSSAFPTEVKFVHYTLQEYVEANHERLFPTAERDMARICLTYLSFIDYESCSSEVLNEQFEDLKFSTYAGYNWHYHLQGVQLELMEQILPFIQDRAKTYALVRRFPPDVRVWGPFLFLTESWTPALFALIWNLADVLLLLISGQSMATPVHVGHGALFLAAFAEHPATLQVLMDHKSDIRTNSESCLTLRLMDRKSDISRNTGSAVTLCLGKCTSENHITSSFYTMMDMLVNKCQDVDAQDKDGQTPLHIAIRWSVFYAVLSSTDESLIKLLLDRGADLNIRDNLGYTPLHCAAFSGTPKIILMLVDRGASLIAKDYTGRVPLHCAASVLYEDNIKVLLRDSELNAQDFKGRTPLHHAYIRWSILKHLTSKHHQTRRSAIALLLQAGASDNIVDVDGRIPSDYSTWSEKEAGELMRQGYQWIGS
ncbi:hypothetical protein JMJ35_000675 [Cladonia borealis]|uniref:Nephrocystin 3-like N-terminal domain-containing protein n=1 Tax=Cladonia borealis TaxID=184061 RepID=A0AA39RB77_9LECA|nr:hypothetical protein JMJ35_000675 [Cladonia borealis]